MFSRSLLSEQLGFRYRTVVIVNPFQESNQASALFNFVGGVIRLGLSDSLRPGRSRNRILGGGFSLRDQTGPGAGAWC
jgi:hypothetical protein